MHGFLGFSYVEETHSFKPTDFELLETAADIFRGHWKAAEQRTDLEHTVRSKDDLIAAVSHELRTPLTGILGFAEALIETSSSDQSEFVSLIADQSRDMADIIEDLLVTARVEVGDLIVRSSSVDLRQIVDGIVVSTKMQALGAGRTIEILGQAVATIGDPVRVRQIVRNLLANAIHHGGKTIRVDVSQAGSSSLIAVWDSGTSLSPEAAARLFDRFYTGQRPRSQPGSVGLGLFLSRQLSHLMAGDLVVELGAEGTTFRLSLPSLANI